MEAGTSGEGQDTEAGGEKKKKTRRKKDPAAPKKALTGYLVYINSKREQIIRENPDADLKDQVCVCVCVRPCVCICRCVCCCGQLQPTSHHLHRFDVSIGLTTMSHLHCCMRCSSPSVAQQPKICVSNVPLIYIQVNDSRVKRRQLPFPVCMGSCPYMCCVDGAGSAVGGVVAASGPPGQGSL